MNHFLWKFVLRFPIHFFHCTLLDINKFISEISSLLLKNFIIQVLPYKVNTNILCRHVDNLFYHAKIVAVDKAPDGEYVYTVHFQVYDATAY